MENLVSCDRRIRHYPLILHRHFMRNEVSKNLNEYKFHQQNPIQGI